MVGGGHAAQGDPALSGETKNDEGRTLAIAGPLAEIMARRQAARLAERRDGEPVVADLVFHNRGHRIVDYRRAWATACKAAGFMYRVVNERTQVQPTLTVVLLLDSRPACMEGSCMGTAIRYFRVNPSGALVRVSLAQMQRWFRGEQVPPALATGGELTFLEALIETEGRQVTEVLRLVPFRWALGRNGKLDRIAAMRLAKKRIELQTRAQGRNGEASAIELLEADANYFWWPTDAQLKLLGSALLGERLDVEELVELRAKVFRPDDARPH